MTELDLENGGTVDPPKRGPGRPKGSTSKTPPAEKNLKARLEATFQKIADSRAARGDDELAVALRDEKGPMALGLVNLTENVKPLRNPLVTFLALIEPALAFGRVGNILRYRLIDRRAERIADDELRRQAADGANDGQVVDGEFVP
jgi:hypothetical protein